MNRRTLNVVTAGLVVFGIGYLVAISARSLPGQESDEPLVRIGFRLPEGFQEAIVWVTLGATAIGALFLVLMIRKGAPGKGPPLRSLYTFVVWLVLLVILYRYSRPVLDEAGDVLSELEDAAAQQEPRRSPTITAASWIVSAVIAAAIAAALVRLAILARTNDWRFEPKGQDEPALAGSQAEAARIIRMEGHDPVARVINAYADFEDETRDAGVGRWESETARRHATRAKTELALDGEQTSELSRFYESARYAQADIDEAAAARAESAWERLKRQLGR